jgi:hypothetical protein
MYEDICKQYIGVDDWNLISLQHGMIHYSPYSAI